ncbi:HlyD family secretion protein [Microbulbifer salipaludis]|uniref:HlyD family secretion protein n=1 Tax=Microbulbifer salipaludis TaxID=187980 RepID=UPI001F5C2773|nr:biotin/lipoyl-binding protein [Microbulbifer salipaludis]
MLAGCTEPDEVALGTLEWDRIALPAPAAEKIVAIHVREGQRVSPGQVLLQLDPEQTLARLGAAEAAVAQQSAALQALNDGPRQEQIARARAELEAAQAEARDRQADYQRIVALGKKNYASRSDIDGAQAAAETAQAQVRAAREQLLELERGTRPEDIEQGRAALAEARAQAQAQRVLLEKLTLRAPRPGIVDSIPFKLGDEAPLGGSLAVLLTGAAPYARVYVPQSMRLRVQVDGQAQVFLEGIGEAERLAGRAGPFPGRVRMVRNAPSFTPYYALTGDDVTRLSYIAEIQLGKAAAQLPAGLPLRASFSGNVGAPVPDGEFHGQPNPTPQSAPVESAEDEPPALPATEDPDQYGPYDGEK